MCVWGALWEGEAGTTPRTGQFQVQEDLVTERVKLQEQMKTLHGRVPVGG